MYKDDYQVKDAKKKRWTPMVVVESSPVSGGYGGERERFWRIDPEAGRHDLRRSLPAARALPASILPVTQSTTARRQKDIIASPHELKDTCSYKSANCLSAVDFRLQPVSQVIGNSASCY